MCINVLEHAVQYFTAIFSVFFFGGILKTPGVTPFIAICKSRLNLEPFSASRNSTIIADKLLKFAGANSNCGANQGLCEKLDV